jgi:hypothetical protein
MEEFQAELERKSADKDERQIYIVFRFWISNKVSLCRYFLF